MFGLVEQGYTLPKEFLEQIGIKIFAYEALEFESLEPDTLGITFFRRGVIGVSKVGYID